MNTTSKALIAIAALMTIGLLAIAPVSAQQLVITSDITPSLTFTIDETAITFPLTVVGVNSMTATNLVSATSNGNYQIKARDLDSAPGTAGHMRAFTPPDVLGVALTNPLQMSADGTTFVSLSGADQTLYSGTPGAFSHAIGLKQTTTISDAVLPSGTHYTLAAVVTASATP